MSKKQHPFLPMFVGDFMAATGEWEGEEQALYALLLMHQWAIGHLPTEVPKLARLARFDQHNFERWWPTVAPKFETRQVEGFGLRLLNRRLEEHRAKSLALSEKNAQAGKRGAAQKWRKDGERHQKPMANVTRIDGERHQSAITKRHPKIDGATDGNPSHPIPSHPDPSQSSASPSAQEDQGGTPTPRTRTVVNGAGDDAHELREQIQAAYPKGLHRGDHWMLAERSIRKLLEQGERPETLLDAAAKYCAQQSTVGTLGTAQVLRPSTFFSTDAWRGPFPLPAASIATPVKRMRTAHEIAEALDPDNTALSGP